MVVPAPLHLRVFLSSPGDVADERDLARKVIKDELPYDTFLHDRVSLDVVSWDDPAARIPMLASLTPQESVNRGIPKPSACDIVVVILWSRMGTPLPDDIRKPSGEPYLSGTEWEYEDALASPREPKPEILVYRRTEEPKIGLADPAWNEKREQYARVQGFFERFRNADGSARGGYHEYATPAEFADQLSSHLRKLLRPRLDALSKPSPAAAQSPAGADSHPPIGPGGASEPGRRIVGVLPQGLTEVFKDRTKVTKQLKELLLTPNSDKRAVIILGRGGMGKTALACKVLKALEADTERVNGLIYLGARSTGVSFDAIYSASADTFGGERKLALKNNEQADTRKKINRLLEYFRNGRYIIFLDNVEDLLNAKGMLTDEDLRLLFDCFLPTDHGARFLITSREELHVSSDELLSARLKRSVSSVERR